MDKMLVVGGFTSNDSIAKNDPSTIGSIGWIVYHYSFPQNPINDWLTEKHKAVYNDVPDLFTECSFATAQALVAAVEATGGDTLPDAMIPALEGMIFDGPKGTYAIRPSDHQALVPMYIVQLDNLTDPDQKFYKLLAEVPANQIIPPVLLPEAIAAERTAMDADFMTEIGAGGS
ncbi:MAG: ABC transporter substrate-binding protein, partial [Anaerolineae bacterium]